MPTFLRKLLSAPQQRYEYSPLDQSARSIRLLRIFPHKSGRNTLRCEMHHADIGSRYTCLSYVWGPPEPTQRISINGKVVEVRENLLHFLEHASRLYPLQLFWIDALCIDQNSVSERNHQVQQMGQIFHGAEEVISWLGNEQGIARFLERPSMHGADFYEFWNSEYWNRAWITQEVTLAKRLVFMAGNKAVAVDMLLEHAKLVSHGSHPAYDRFKVLERNALSTFKGMSLLQLLDLFKLKECERVRERVYSLLALCGEGSNVQVDYDLSRKDTLKHVLRCCHGSLCWCSVNVLHRTLKVHTNNQVSLATGERHFAQFTVLVDEYEGDLDAQASVTLCLNKMCDRGQSTLVHISPGLDEEHCDIPSEWLAHWNSTRYRGACTLVVADDRKSVTVRMSISTLVELVRGLEQDGICHNHKTLGPSLQLCGRTSGRVGSAAVIQLMEVDRNVERVRHPDLRDLLDGQVKINLSQTSDVGADRTLTEDI